MNIARAIKSRLFNIQLTLSKREFLVCLSILLLATYMFASRSWEPAGESFKNWVSARILRETGGFPRINHGILSSIYLQLFSFFDYPLSIQLEHFVTHLFAYSCIFLFLRKFLPSIPALILTCAWIPALWTVEGGGTRIAGMGFLALYFRADKKSVMNRGYLPVTLGVAALFDTVYIPFLLGHVIGMLIKRYSNKEPLITFSHSLRRENVFSLIVKAIMILVVILTISFQSKRPDNNCHEFHYPWAPFPQTEALTISSLAVANWRYVVRNFPESEWLYQDWYFTNKEATGGAQSILQAALNKPGIFVRNIIENIPGAIMLPLYFMTGLSFPPGLLGIPLLLLSWLLLPIWFYRVFLYFRQNDLTAHLYSVIFGTGAIVAALLLVWFSARYMIVLLPVGLLMAAHIGTSLKSLMSFTHKLASNRPQGILTINLGSRESKIFSFIGLFLILLGLLVNERFVTNFISHDGALILSTKILIWSIDSLLISIGILLIIKRNFFSAVFNQIKNGHYSNTQSWFTNAIILLMAGCILFFSLDRNENNTWLSNLSKNPFLLSGKMVGVHRQLLASINKETRVLAVEEPWIRAFSDVGLDNAFNVLFLPPFEDFSGETEKFLESLDIILVSDEFSKKAPSIATQVYLRYELHLQPFLQKALKKGWIEQDIEGFGKIYRCPSSS